MDKYVISEQLSNYINNRKVLAGAFTTFTFEPDFFELDVIPLLLSSGIPYSSDDRVKTFQVREALRESGIALEVFYDLPVFRKSAETSPSMEYLCHGVKHNNGVFHAKNNYILVKDKETDDLSLLFSAGSNNLSRTGWWENIEVQHWEEVNNQQPMVFIQQLIADIDYLIGKRSSLNKQLALDAIKKYLNQLTGSKEANSVYYFSLSGGNSFNGFLDEIKHQTLATKDDWTLEIISPFFADNNKNQLHTDFLKNFGVSEIVMLLPRDQENIALCEQEYYEHINKSDGIKWGKWNPKITNSLGVSGDLFRHIHAKIFHFYNTHTRKAWVFVGSVNFSYKAMNDNVETGFFVRLDNVEALLKPYSDDEQIERFQTALEHEPSDSIDEGQAALPELHISYDWVNKKLLGHTAEGSSIEVNINSTEGAIIVKSWVLTEHENTYENDTKQLEVLLSQGSLINITGHNVETQEPFLEHKILLQQIGWSHKAIDLPSLTLEQILSIYAGMSTERRLMLLINTQVKELVLKQMGGEMSVGETEVFSEQFFCEYAEIFLAFRTLKTRLLTSLENKEFVQMDYYLTGAGMDSLPQLTKRSGEHDMDGFNSVTSYLLLLSAKDLYDDKRFRERVNVAAEREIIEEKIVQLKTGNSIKLEDDSPSKRKAFFSWFESQFFKQYESKVMDEGSK